MSQRWIAIAMVAWGCGSSSNGPDLTVTTSFPITRFLGGNPSPLDPLMGQTIAMQIVWPPVVNSNHGDGTDPNGCRSTAIYGASTRTATGATSATVQAELLDPLPDWDVVLQLCTVGKSSIIVNAVIDRLNLGMTCFGIPPSALAKDSNGDPAITSFTATMCDALILDVNNNREIGNDNFEITFATGPDRIP